MIDEDKEMVHAQCVVIAQKLPDYFTPEGITQMEKDLETDTLKTNVLDGQITGFATYRDEGDVREITWLAVDPEHQRHGIASSLVREIEQAARESNLKKVIVKTLADDNYTPYRATRAFYEKQGYKLTEVIDPYPGWDPGNPCGIYTKELSDPNPPTSKS